MARPTGSKVIKCEKCGRDVVALVGEKGVCKNCGKTIKFTKKLLKSLGKDV